jgi:NADPH:quinone reductase
MRAAVCREYGPPEVIQVSDVPSPAVGDGQVRVRVGAAAVNFPDVLFMANRYQLTIPVPFVPGSEFAGVVTEIGPGVSDVCAGDRVMGTTTVGASVTAVASSDAKLSVASAYGASGLINHRSAAGGLRQALRAAFPDGTDAVIDPVGGDLAEPALRALRWGAGS